MKKDIKYHLALGLVYFLGGINYLVFKMGINYKLLNMKKPTAAQLSRFWEFDIHPILGYKYRNSVKSVGLANSVIEREPEINRFKSYRY